MANVTSTINKSINKNDNNKKQRAIIFLLVNSRDHKVIGRLKCFQPIFFHYLAYKSKGYLEIKVSLVGIEGYIC